MNGKANSAAMTLSGKVILVTGAANGIGRDSALLFANHGARVVVGDLDVAAGRQVAERINDAGGAASAILLDVRDEASIAAAINQTVESYGRLDGAFNNAGVPNARKLLHELDWSEWSRVIAIDLSGVFLCMKHEIQAMLKGGGGVIVNTASCAGVTAVPRCGEYIAAKHGVVGLTKSAALDYATSNIRVNAVLPGLIDTERVQGSYVATAADQELGAWMLAHHAMKRRGKGSEVAEAAAWLFSDAASFVTGVALPVDGGYLTS